MDLDNLEAPRPKTPPPPVKREYDPGVGCCAPPHLDPRSEFSASQKIDGPRKTAMPQKQRDAIKQRKAAARLEEVKNFGANTGHAYRTFEKYLTRHQPAVGHAHFDWQPYNKSKEVELLTGNFDAIVNAFRRDVLDVLLPYETLWDRHSWHYSQFVVHTLTSALFPTGRMQFNALRVKPVSYTHLTLPTILLV